LKRPSEQAGFEFLEPKGLLCENPASAARLKEGAWAKKLMLTTVRKK
jgi:hypothetical protein